MAGYGTFQRARKGLGSRRGMRRGNYSRGSRYGYKKTGAAIKPRFATVGFSRNVEKKYFDKTYQANHSESQTGGTASGKSSGMTYISNTWGTYSFGASGSSVVTSNDMFKGLATGTTARTRIGNKIKIKYVKGAFTFTAAVLGDGTAAQKTQGGESLATVSVVTHAQSYLRTTYRMVIVKDMQVNSTDTQVTWSQVFDTSNLQAGVHSELNVDNMGRFVVLEDKVFTLDSDTPQKTCTYNIGGNTLGSVRYNGPSDAALTDKGVYVIWAAFVMGYTSTMAMSDIDCPSPVGHSRLCFTDD